MKVSLCKGRFRGIFNPAQLDLDETLEYWSDGVLSTPSLQLKLAAYFFAGGAGFLPMAASNSL